ncbi:MAG: biotin/lipoyl-binding protein, partial [Rhizobiaceae bacterium]|nr:biotin/lipoyl-binding protein [Rhizobiaceae bacterium]
MSEVNTPQQEDWRESVPTKLKDVTRFGRNVVGGFMVIFFFWSILFPLSSGVVASGTVISAGQNKAIQHPIGGIVEKLHVRDGQKVVAGQSVITLDPVVDQSEQRRLQARFLMVQALASRLKAQLLTRENVVFPDDFYVGSEIQLRGVPNFKQPRSEYIAELISDQRFEFDAARDRHTKEVATIEAQISTLLKEEQGLSATVKSQKEQLAIISG